MLLVNDKIIFIHFPKTAGTKIHNCLINNNNSIIVDRHSGLKNIGKIYLDIPKFGLIRNPFTFYVSFYNMFRNSATLTFENNNKIEIDTRIDLDEYDFDEVKDDFNLYVKNLINADCTNTGEGHITRLYKYLYQDSNGNIPEDLTVIKFEELHKVNDFLKLNGVPEIDLTETVRKGRSKYYTPELIELIKDKDKYILDKYNYTVL